MTTIENKRREDRVNVVLPVMLGKTNGLTRNVSASGICFEVDASYAAGSEVSFVIELETSTEKMLLKCKGSIVRTEDHDGKNSVAVKIIESVMEAAD